ncbi:MAG: M48 family metalloprotease [Desulfobacterales bacterium]|nr:M48 family metalloprotease [Desulfobacterales bacterium]
MATPAYAQLNDLFKIIDPKGENEDLQKIGKIAQGAGSILASSTDMDYKSEFSIGESLALEGFRRYGLPLKSQRFQKYVNTIGNAVARNSSRPKIPYYFVVVDSPLYNAFACPGGIIFISSTLVRNLVDESELACVLAHEVGHVSLKHALQTIKRAKFFEGVGQISEATMKGEKGKEFQSMIGDLQTAIFDNGLDQNMEHEADAAAMEIAYRTGYDPYSMIRVLLMLQNKEKDAEKAGSWFSTHPPLSERIRQTRALKPDYPDAHSLPKVHMRFIRHRKLM